MLSTRGHLCNCKTSIFTRSKGSFPALTSSMSQSPAHSPSQSVTLTSTQGSLYGDLHVLVSRFHSPMFHPRCFLPTGPWPHCPADPAQSSLIINSSFAILPWPRQQAGGYINFYFTSKQHQESGLWTDEQRSYKILPPPRIGIELSPTFICKFNHVSSGIAGSEVMEWNRPTISQFD